MCEFILRSVLFFIVSYFTVFGVYASDTDATAYSFDSNGISRDVLENYLDRSITMMYFLTPDRPEGRWQYPYHRDDVRMVKDLGAKFIGRAIYRWGGESRLNDPDYWSRAKELETEMHEYYPEMILQGCLFEIVTRDVENVRNGCLMNSEKNANNVISDMTTC